MLSYERQLNSLWPSAYWDIDLGRHWVSDSTKPLHIPMLTWDFWYLSQYNLTEMQKICWQKLLFKIIYLMIFVHQPEHNETTLHFLNWCSNSSFASLYHWIESNGLLPVLKLRPDKNGQNFADNIFKCIFFHEGHCDLIMISLKGAINNKSSLFQIMAWCHMLESMMTQFSYGFRVTQPQRVKFSTGRCLELIDFRHPNTLWEMTNFN